jgi:AcrR family transcriptional regulator
MVQASVIQKIREAAMQQDGQGARTTAEIRRQIQQSSGSIRALAKRFGVNPKTVAKWRARASIEDRRAGPKDLRSRVLSPEEEALAVALRGCLRLPLDDTLEALRPAIPHLTRSSLHRCLERHGISRLPGRAELPAGAALTGAVELSRIEIGAGARTLYVFVAIDAVSRFIFADLRESLTAKGVLDMLGALMAATPGGLRAVLSEEAPLFGDGEAGQAYREFCEANGVERRAVAIRPPWSEDQRTRMKSTVEAAAAARLAAEGIEGLRRRLAALLSAYNNEAKLEVLGGLSPQAHAARKSLGEAAASARRQRRRNPDSTREAILEAARGRLAKDGPEGLSLSEVARVAGVNRGTAYQHFKTRENLIKATAEWVSDKLYRAVFGETDAPTPRPTGFIDPGELMDRLAGFAMDNPELTRAWLLAVLSSEDPSQDRFWREYQGSTERFARTELARENIDSEVLSVIMLAGAFLWPVWARTQARPGADLQPFAHRFAQESLRISTYGNLRPEHYPAIVERLKGAPAHQA